MNKEFESESRHGEIERRHTNALRKIAPNINQGDYSTWQQQKSSQTKILLLETTLKCLARYGYPKTTTKMVTEKANVSRGALLHHFATRQDLIIEAIEYMFYCQLDNFYKTILQLSEQQRVLEIAGVDVYWEFLKTKEFEAYQELAMASRTDSELRKIFVPKDIEFRRVWKEELPYLFPEWQGREEHMLLARDLVSTTMHGLLLNMHHIVPKERRARLRKLIATISLQLRSGELELPEISEKEINIAD